VRSSCSWWRWRWEQPRKWLTSRAGACGPVWPLAPFFACPSPRCAILCWSASRELRSCPGPYIVPASNVAVVVLEIGALGTTTAGDCSVTLESPGGLLPINLNFTDIRLSSASVVTVYDGPSLSSPVATVLSRTQDAREVVWVVGGGELELEQLCLLSDLVGVGTAPRSGSCLLGWPRWSGVVTLRVMCAIGHSPCSFNAEVFVGCPPGAVSRNGHSRPNRCEDCPPGRYGGGGVPGSVCTACPASTPFSVAGTGFISQCSSCSSGCDNGLFGKTLDSPCPGPGWLVWYDRSGVEGVASCLRVVSASASWSEAQDACVSFGSGSHLLTVRQVLCCPAAFAERGVFVPQRLPVVLHTRALRPACVRACVSGSLHPGRFGPAAGVSWLRSPVQSASVGGCCSGAPKLVSVKQGAVKF
jgi:hypothetical protein